jgi:glucose-6-phosphate-specific signal transduction histidine kinase
MSAALTEIAREGVNNAIFHGDAQTVEIFLDITPAGNAQIVVEDDGGGTNGKQRAGLGTELLDSVTIRWALTRDGAHTRLTAELAILEAD